MSRHRRHPWTPVLAAIGLGLVAGVSCQGGCALPGTRAVAPQREAPGLRIVVASDLAGAIEPCGCQADMLGGLDHAAAYLRKKSRGTPTLVVGAGPLLFEDPELPKTGRQQAIWKAEALAKSLDGLGFAGWAPGYNDFSAGPSELTRLAGLTGAPFLAGNLTGPLGAVGHRLVTLRGVQVGFVGVADPKDRSVVAKGITVGDAEAAARAGLTAIGSARVKVLLAAMPRGRALRLAERVPGFDLVAVGRPVSRGDGNDAPVPPVRVGKSLVVQAPNHLQGLSVVEFHFPRTLSGRPAPSSSAAFADGTGVETLERIGSLERRIASLREGISTWEKDGSVSAKDLAARKQDLERFQKELASLEARKAPEPEGSFFTYELVEVREKLGVDEPVKGRLGTYYERVNEHNRKAYADRKPPPVPEGKSGYLGIEACAACHQPAKKFWDGTRHAGAYATLATDHKQFNLDCVGCHVTGYEEPGGSTVTHVDALKNVQCEVCHGPGSRHVQNPTDNSLIVRAPAESLCADKCHHPPHVGPEWSRDIALKGILGPGHGGQ